MKPALSLSFLAFALPLIVGCSPPHSAHRPTRSSEERPSLNGPLSALVPSDFEVGQVGLLDDWSLRIWSIIDEDSMLVALDGMPRHPFVVQGISTTGEADGKLIRLRGKWLVAGTAKVGFSTRYVLVYQGKYVPPPPPTPVVTEKPKPVNPLLMAPRIDISPPDLWRRSPHLEGQRVRVSGPARAFPYRDQSIVVRFRDPKEPARYLFSASVPLASAGNLAKLKAATDCTVTIEGRVASGDHTVGEAKVTAAVLAKPKD